MKKKGRSYADKIVSGLDYAPTKKEGKSSTETLSWGFNYKHTKKKSKTSTKMLALGMTAVMFVAIIVALYSLMDANYPLFFFAVFMAFLFYLWIFFFEKIVHGKK